MRDLNEVLDLVLRLPVGGKTYVVDPPPAHIGAHLLNRLTFGIAADAGIDLGEEQARAIVVDEEGMPDFARQCLGSAYDQMVADGVAQPQLEFCVTTALFAWTIGKAFAEEYWESGGKLVRPAEQRPTTPPTATRTRAAAASTTRTSASASGTRTTRKTKGKRKR